jgi:hypothetical protein
MEPQSPLEVAELRFAITEHLDWQSLLSVMRVSHGWAEAAIRCLWRGVPASALRPVRSDRRHIYSSAIRSLVLSMSADIAQDTQGWEFPLVEELYVHAAAVAIATEPTAFSELLDRCGPHLSVLTIDEPNFCDEHAHVAAGNNNNQGNEDGQVDVLGSDSVDAANHNETHGGERPRRQLDAIHPSVLRVLAGRAGLRAIHDHSACITGASIIHVLEIVPQPFAGLMHLCAQVFACDAVPLVKMLAVNAKLTELSLKIVTLTAISTTTTTTTATANAPTSTNASDNNDDDNNAVDNSGSTLAAIIGRPTARTRNALLRALVKHMPQLRTLVLWYLSPPLRPPPLLPAGTTTAADAAAADPTTATFGIVTDPTAVTAAALEAPENGDAYSDDVSVLSKLHELTELSLVDAFVCMDEATWRTLLSGLPQLTLLAVDGVSVLPPAAAAFVAAGRCCRQLRKLQLPLWPEGFDTELERVLQDGVHSEARLAGLTLGGDPATGPAEAAATAAEAVAAEATTETRTTTSNSPPGFVLFPDMHTLNLWAPTTLESDAEG